jgi:hypothetical protein
MKGSKMHTKELELICTTQNKSQKFYRFINSLVNCSKYVKIHLILVDQCNKNFIVDDYNKYFLITYIKTDKISLSKARNIGIKYLKGWNFVAFPDDDCWYDVNEIIKVFNVFQKKVDVVCTNVYDPLKKKYYGRRPISNLNINCMNILTLPVSVGIFFNAYNINFNNISFNEKLGAGTSLGSGEESELLVKLFEENKIKILYDGTIKVFHEDEHTTITSEKAYKYAYGYSVLIFSLANKYNKCYYFIFMKVLLSIFLGVIIHKKEKRVIAYNRLRGLIKGLGKTIYEQ